MHRCSGGNIRVRSLELFALAAAIRLTASAQDLGALTGAYAANPGMATRSALLRYAAAHNDTSGALALLAVSHQDVQGDRRGEALRNLEAAAPRLPQLADYITWLSASARFANREFDAAAAACETVLKQQPKSPLAAQAAMLAG